MPEVKERLCSEHNSMCELLKTALPADLTRVQSEHNRLISDVKDIHVCVCGDPAEPTKLGLLTRIEILERAHRTSLYVLGLAIAALFAAIAQIWFSKGH